MQKKSKFLQNLKRSLEVGVLQKELTVMISTVHADNGGLVDGDVDDEYLRL